MKEFKEMFTSMFCLVPFFGFIPRTLSIQKRTNMKGRGPFFMFFETVSVHLT